MYDFAAELNGFIRHGALESAREVCLQISVRARPCRDKELEIPIGVGTRKIGSSRSFDPRISFPNFTADGLLSLAVHIKHMLFLPSLVPDSSRMRRLYICLRELYSK